MMLNDLRRTRAVAALFFCATFAIASAEEPASLAPRALVQPKGEPATDEGRPDILTQEIDEGLPASAQFGAAVELGEIGSERALAVSAPGSGATGEVFVYRQAEADAFALLDTISPAEPSTAFGKSLLLEDRYLFVVSDLGESQMEPRIHVYRIIRQVIFCLFPPCPPGADIAGIDLVISGASGKGTPAFGDSLAIDDINAPDSYRLIIGDPDDCEDETVCSGAVYFFEFTPFDSQLRQLAKIKSDFAAKTAKIAQTPTRFGATIRARNGKVAIGAPGSPIDSALTGSVDLFDLIQGNLQTAGVVAGDEAGDGFGDAADLNDDYLVVGAPGANSGSGEVVAYPLQGFGGDRVEITTSENMGASGFGSKVEVDPGLEADTTVTADANNPYTDRPADASLILRFSIQAILAAMQKGVGDVSVVIDSDTIVSSSPTGGPVTTPISISSGFGLLAFSQTSAEAGTVEVSVSVPSLFKSGFEPGSGGIEVLPVGRR